MDQFLAAVSEHSVVQLNDFVLRQEKESGLAKEMALSVAVY